MKKMNKYKEMGKRNTERMRKYKEDKIGRTKLKKEKD
jgi:hypothetical protein